MSTAKQGNMYLQHSTMLPETRLKISKRRRRIINKPQSKIPRIGPKKIFFFSIKKLFCAYGTAISLSINAGLLTMFDRSNVRDVQLRKRNVIGYT